MKWLIFLVTFCSVGWPERKPPIRGYMKCIPFSTKTAVDLHEEGMLKMKVPKIKFGIPVTEQWSDKKTVQLLYQALKMKVRKNEGVAGDCDLRMVLRFTLPSGLVETFYINWDQEGLIYNLRNYSLTKNEFKLIQQAFDCSTCMERFYKS